MATPVAPDVLVDDLNRPGNYGEFLRALDELCADWTSRVALTAAREDTPAYWHRRSLALPFSWVACTSGDVWLASRTRRGECPRICVGMSEQERHAHEEQHAEQD